MKDKKELVELFALRLAQESNQLSAMAAEYASQFYAGICESMEQAGIEPASKTQYTAIFISALTEVAHGAASKDTALTSIFEKIISISEMRTSVLDILEDIVEIDEFDGLVLDEIDGHDPENN